MTLIRSKLAHHYREDATLEPVAVVALLIDPGKVSSKLAHRQQDPPHWRPWPSCPVAGGRCVHLQVEEGGEGGRGGVNGSDGDGGGGC